MIKQVTMSIMLRASCASVCTPDGFALKARCERLRKELKANKLTSLYKKEL